MYLPVAGRFFTLIVPDGKEKGTYQSRLFKIDSHHLYIGIPRTSDSAPAHRLPPGTNVVLDYQDAQDIPCQFATVVVDVSDDSFAQLLVLKCPQTIERHQRRENARIPVSWLLTCESPVQGRFTARMNDLSGGGLSAWIPDNVPLAPGDKADMQFAIPSGKQQLMIHTAAEVISAFANDEPERSRYLCSFQFTSLEEDLRHRIVEYVFERQKLDVALRHVGSSFVF